MTRLRLIAVAAGAIVLAAASVALAAAASGAGVSIENFVYTPPQITIAAGTTVTWTNNDDTPHTVRAVDGSFHSAAMDTDDHYSFTFTRPGVYNYFCTLHPKMVGKVIVK